MKKYQLVSLFWLLSSMYGQSLVDIRTQTKNVDFSGASYTIPAKSGTALPATCNVGELFFETTASPGQNLYSCAPANTWTLIQGTGTGTVSMGNTGQFAYYAANGATISGHSLTASDIPALNYQTPLTFTGNGSKTATSTGNLLSSDCAKWDANGNIIDAGAPCGTVAAGNAGQFAFYSASGSALAPHTLAASDIPALNYQSLLTFTGNGPKTASSLGTLTSSDCAKWDANGNIIDAGAPCGTVATGSAGQFAFYSAAGSALTAHTLSASDIPPLSYQSPLTFTGNGAKTASSAGTLTSSDCAKWDSNGNIIDAGAPCGTVATGSAGQFAFYSAAGSSLTAHSLVASDIPALNYQSPLTFTGSGSQTVSSTGSGSANNCAKWDSNGNIVDAGSPCGTGSSGGGGITAPSSTTVGNIPQYSNTIGSALSAGLAVVTTLGSPGVNTNIPTEEAVRAAIAAASSASGNLPAQTGTAGYLVTNGASASWGNIVTGASGALDCASTPGVCDVVTAVVPLKATANVMTGVNKFSQLQVAVSTVSQLPACNSSLEGQMEGVSDAVSPSYLAPVTGGGSTHVPVYCNGTNWVAH